MLLQYAQMYPENAMSNKFSPFVNYIVHLVFLLNLAFYFGT